MLDTEMYTRLLRRALRDGGDYADVFCERRSSVSYRLQEGHIHEGTFSLTQGVGVRVVCGESAGYGYSDDMSEAAVLRAAEVASLIARNGAKGTLDVAGVRPEPVVPMYDQERTLHEEPKVYAALLERAETAARAYDARVRSVNAHVSDELQEVWIATSDGQLLADRRPLVSFGVQAVAVRERERGSGYNADGGRTSIQYYTQHEPEQIAREAARIALVNLEAMLAPAGEMEVIVGAGAGGVLLHEAVGHGLEGDFNRRGVSLYSGRIGERVASELVTIYDDGNLPGERGTVSIDDEGVSGQHKVLVERGILRSYMQDRLNARMMNTHSTGSGRRQSFRVMPQPRMCNTYMPSGSSTFDEIVASTKRGLFAKSFAGGQVEISKGDFVFMVAEGYLVENGRITAPVKNATIIGNGPHAMTLVTAVGNDSRLAARHYTCGKGGQYVPVGVGMPTVKIAAITVGGTHDE